MSSTFDGLLVLDKPGGITSRAAINRAAPWFPAGARIGHTGTLDPLATGVLVLCVGSATRLVEYVQNMSKTYRTEILLGATSDTDDADGTVKPLPDAARPERAVAEKALEAFVGEIEQVPPAYSAARVNGQRAHELARRGRDVHLQPRRVRIHAIELLAYDYPALQLEVHCGKGTYIRSLARDLGERLGCGALVRTLRRTRVGPFRAEEALSLDADSAAARSRLLPPAAALSELPRICVPESQAAKLCQGHAIPWALPQPETEDHCAVFDERGEPLAVVRVDARTGLLRPEKVLRSR